MKKSIKGILKDFRDQNKGFEFKSFGLNDGNFQDVSEENYRKLREAFNNGWETHNISDKKIKIPKYFNSSDYGYINEEAHIWGLVVPAKEGRYAIVFRERTQWYEKFNKWAERYKPSISITFSTLSLIIAIIAIVIAIIK